MAIFAITAALAGAAIGGGLSAAGAASRNKAIAQAQDQAYRQALQQVRQVDRRSAFERTQRISRLRQDQGILEVLEAEGLGGSFTVRLNQLASDARTDLQTSRVNQALTRESIFESLDATWQSLQSQAANTGVEIATGALGGAASGLSLASSLQGIGLGGGAGRGGGNTPPPSTPISTTPATPVSFTTSTPSFFSSPAEIAFGVPFR